jgi:hypothetical protein
VSRGAVTPLRWWLIRRLLRISDLCIDIGHWAIRQANRLVNLQ